MAITITDTMQKVWNYLTSNGMTQAGAAGMMGNMYAESGIIPNRVEILCLKRLKENGKIYTDSTYTAFVDDGTISRAEFLNPLPNKQYGYGLCQWTSPSRKAGLYDLCKKKNTSIGNVNSQLAFLISELKSSFYSVWKVLSSTADISAASDIVLTKFEMPGDVGASVKSTRSGYGKEIYNAFSKSKSTANTAASSSSSESSKINKVIEIATAELGYLEKASNSNLYDKTANAGSNNYTKYWADLYPGYQGQPWCAIFVSWCLYKAFGLEASKKLLKHWPFVYCPTLAGMTSNKTAQKGSIVLFYRNGDYAHTGLVIDVSGSSFTTIEGNTSGASGIVANGGGVCKKTYTLSSLSSNTKFFMPDYSSVSATSTTSTSSTAIQAQAQAQTTAAKTSSQLSETPKWNGKVNIQKLNVRKWAGKEYARITSCPIITKDEVVEVCDTLKDNNGSNWYFVRIKKLWYGFVMAKYITKV